MKVRERLTVIFISTCAVFFVSVNYMCLKHISAYWNILIKSSFSKRKNLPLCNQDIASMMSGPGITSQSTVNGCYCYRTGSPILKGRAPVPP